MPDNDANHSRLAALQAPIDWDATVCDMLLSMADDVSARTPTTEEDLDLDRFKRSLGSAPPAKFNSEGGLREPWAGGMDSNHDRGFDTRGSPRIETDSEATVRRRPRVERRLPSGSSREDFKNFIESDYSNIELYNYFLDLFQRKPILMSQNSDIGDAMARWLHDDNAPRRDDLTAVRAQATKAKEDARHLYLVAWYQAR